MSKPNDSRGGAIAIRGLLVQTIVALLDITKADPPFTEIILEPMVGDDQFDFLWKDANASCVKLLVLKKNCDAMRGLLYEIIEVEILGLDCHCANGSNGTVPYSPAPS